MPKLRSIQGMRDCPDPAPLPTTIGMLSVHYSDLVDDVSIVQNRSGQPLHFQLDRHAKRA
jgi:hypothetical protein